MERKVVLGFSKKRCVQKKEDIIEYALRWEPKRYFVHNKKKTFNNFNLYSSDRFHALIVNGILSILAKM